MWLPLHSLHFLSSYFALTNILSPRVALPVSSAPRVPFPTVLVALQLRSASSAWPEPFQAPREARLASCARRVATRMPMGGMFGLMFHSLHFVITFYTHEYPPLVYSTTCKQCPAGSFADATGHLSVSQCKLCPEGKYQDAMGRNECKSCPPRTFANVKGLSECKSCEA